MTRWSWLLLALIGLAPPTPSSAEQLVICVRDLAPLRKPAQHAFISELRLLFPRTDVTTDSNPCTTETGADVVQLLVKRRLPDIPPDVLGLTIESRGRILPRIEVFSESVANFTRAGDLQVFGRALARVAAHELGHYLRQTADHEDRGLMRADLPSAELVAADRSPFLDYPHFE